MQWQKVVALTLFLGAVLPAGTIHLKTRTIDTGALPPDYQSASGIRWRDGMSHYLLQFKAPVSDEDRDALAQRGAVITGSVPDNAVMVVAGDDFSPDGLDLEYAGRLHPEDKVSPEVENTPDGSAFVIEFHADVDPAEAQALLNEQDLTVLSHPDLSWNHVLVTGTKQNVLDLQAWDEIDYIFPASDDLVSGQAVHLCAGALSTDGANTGQYVVVGHGWPKDASGKVTLGYAFSELTAAVPAATLKSEILRALTAWTSYAPIQFIPQTNPLALQTMNIEFASGDHGDGFPFSPEILAHTFYPSNPEPIAGDMHLNMDEPWHSGSNIDVYTVALHEAGHALGLGHSDQPGAIMYPYYRLGAQIASADIQGLQSLYGPALVAAPPVTPLTITISSVTPATTAATIALSGTTANGTGSKLVTWQTNQKTSGTAAGGATWSATVPLVTGSNTITVTATDANHQQSMKSVTITRSALAAASPTTTTTSTTSTPTAAPQAPGPIQSAPQINITSPSSTIVQTSQSTISISGTAGTPTAKVTWQNGPEGTGLAAGTASWTAAVPLLVGTNNVVLKAFDAAGNSSWRSMTVVRR